MKKKVILQGYSWLWYGAVSKYLTLGYRIRLTVSKHSWQVPAASARMSRYWAPLGSL